MKQTPQPEVQPRRNVLTALGCWVAGLWATQLAFAQGTTADKPKAACGPAASESDKDKGHQLTRIVGSLCLSASLRKDFFAAANVDAAKKVLEDRKLYSEGFWNKSKPQVKCAVEALYAARTTQSATSTSTSTTTTSTAASAQSVFDTTASFMQSSGAVPCPEWPC